MARLGDYAHPTERQQRCQQSSVDFFPYTTDEDVHCINLQLKVKMTCFQTAGLQLARQPEPE